jgi:hypothetical protein
LDRSWSGDLGELIVYERALTNSERRSVEEYLALRYATHAVPLPRPVISPNGGPLTAPTAVSITAAPGTTLHYTTDGSEPTVASPMYGGSFLVDVTTTVKAKVFRGTRSSPTAVVRFLTDAEFHPGQLSGLKLWVRADAGVQEGEGRVSQWADVSGTGSNGAMTQSTWLAQPTWVTDAGTGRPALRFDGADDVLMFPTRLTTIRTVFWVVHESSTAPADYRTLLGDVSTYHFLGGASRQIWGGYTSSLITGGETRLNGAVINGSTTNRPTTPSILSVTTTGAVTADGFTRDRSYNRTWFGDLAELIVYDRVVSAAERQQIEQYLAGKYGITIP